MENSFSQNLFWFAPSDVRLDLSNPAVLRTVVQQVLTHGRTKDVKILLRTLPRDRFRDVFEKMKRFLPKSVRVFWEAYFVCHQ